MYANSLRCLLSNACLAVDMSLSIAFTVLLYRYWMRTAGVLEWALTYVGAFWLWSFVGYLKSDKVDSRYDQRLMCQ